MKKKFFALMFVCAFVLSGVGAIDAQIAKSNLPVNLLPASDGAMTFNMQRLLNEALPQTLSGNQPMLAGILGKIDEVKATTGIDLRQFEQIAVGVSSRKNAAGELDFEPVVLARGTLNANALLALAKIAANARYREEKIGSRAVYIFSPRDLIKRKQTPRAPSAKAPSMIEKALDRMVAGLSRELAVAAFDNNTLAIGSPARLRETFGATPRIGGEVLDLISRKPNALINFSLKLPGGLSNFVKLDNDELGKTLDSIRFMAGAIDMNNGNAAVLLTAKTLRPEQAQSFHEQLEGFQNIGKIFLGGAKGADKQLYSRLVENVKIARAADEVTLDLQVPQSDINFLLDKFIKPKAQTSSSK
ncbi:MAG TPA: hypothetical protein VNI84_15595 [Pyrinomonadaceae bacterium]|nr:hypothetical protein [Pyrinomonadaceae bacterium]